jgi:hypothetical protein
MLVDRTSVDAAAAEHVVEALANATVLAHGNDESADPVPEDRAPAHYVSERLEIPCGDSECPLGAAHHVQESVLAIEVSVVHRSARTLAQESLRGQCVLAADAASPPPHGPPTPAGRYARRLSQTRRARAAWRSPDFKQGGEGAADASPVAPPGVSVKYVGKARNAASKKLQPSKVRGG